MTMRKVLGITAIRSEYYLQRPIFQAIRDHTDLELEIVVAGAHLSELHGHTVRDVEADGFTVAARIESLEDQDTEGARLTGAATELNQLVGIIEQHLPDWLLAPTDREEAMVMALCGAYLNVPTAHYSAGDRVVGNVDDTVRHAISSLSHLLLTTSEDSRQRLIRQGQEAWRVHTVGHAGLDRIRTTPEMSRDELAKALEVDQLADTYAVVTQHPLSSETAEAGRHMAETLAAVRDLRIQAFINYPNSDAGRNAIIREIEQVRDDPLIHVFRNVADVPFVNMLRAAALLIGNSSLGIMEAPFMKLPVINVGLRQTGRHHAENVFFVPNDRAAIIEAADKILNDGETRKRIRNCENPFGDGKTGEKVAELLAKTPIDDKLLIKDLTY